MFIVPFFTRAPLPSVIQWKIAPITLFLENHGKGLCIADNKEEWLASNGFVIKNSWIKEDVVYVEIDRALMNLSDFYSYEQLTREQKKGTEECWKTFFVMETDDSDEKNSEKAWNENIENPFSTIIVEIQRMMKISL